jgi:DNA-binding CsgD family transcriptional regulator/tetratricopeptide (TPR) repeat protein
LSAKRRFEPSVTAQVGRAEELDTITALLDSADGDPVALIIEGEPGIGKTTLWLDALQRARERGIQVLTVRASAAESVLAYAGLADLLGDVDHEMWAKLPPPQRRGLSAALLTEQAPIAGVDQRAVGAAFLTVLTQLTTESPVVVAIDDLQWLDGSTAAAVAFAARRVSSRVVWVCTARTDSDPTHTNWLESARPGAVRRIRLAPLPIGDLHDMLTAQLGTPLPRPRLLRIYQLSSGNPFYAMELAREFYHRGDGDVRLPASLTELTRARIASVADHAGDALLAIASLADPTVPTVATAIDVASQRLLELLADAEAQKVVAIDGNRIRFTHPLLSHAVHWDATPSRRRAMHRRLAAVVTEPELRARHLALADPAGEPETLGALDEAAEIARGRGAPAAAAELIELAINLGGVTVERRIRLAQCLFDAGGPSRAREALEAAIASSAAGPRRAEALLLLVMVRLYDDSFLEAAELCRRALTDCVDDSALKVGVVTTLAFAELNTGRPDLALTTAEQAVAIAERLNAPESLGPALSMRAIMQFMNGEGLATDDLRRTAALGARGLGMPLALRPRVQTALLRGWTGDIASARAEMAELTYQSTSAGEEGELMFLDFQATVFDIWLGDLRRASTTANEATRRAGEIGGDAGLFLASSMQAAVAVYQGRVDDARAHLDVALTVGARTGYVLMMSWTIATQAFLELSLGDHARALAAVEPLLPILKAMPRYSELLGTGFLPDAIEAMLALARNDEAEPLIEVLERNGARLDRAWMLAVGARCRALLLVGRGDVAAAVARTHEALTQHARVDMPFERARTLLVLGRLERRLRHWAPATAALTEALAVFEGMGARLWAEQVRAELDRGSAGRTRSKGLTPTERRVADLAAGGMSNHDIAATLFIARKTVEVNLSRIYHKLGIHSRIELFHLMNKADLGELNL